MPMGDSGFRFLRALLVPALAALAIVSVGSAADAAPGTRCAGATVTTRTASPSPTGWAENLTFDHSGNLWVSRLYGNWVERYDRSGRRTATVPVWAPGALRVGPGGDLYVNSGDQLSFGTERNGVVVKLDPLAAQPNPTVYARVRDAQRAGVRRGRFRIRRRQFARSCPGRARWRHRSTLDG